MKNQMHRARNSPPLRLMMIGGPINLLFSVPGSLKSLRRGYRGRY